MDRLLTILTVRSNSERLPGKALAPIKSRTPSGEYVTRPLSVWIVRRLKQLHGMLVVATTKEDSDNELAQVLGQEGIEVIRGSTDDVIDRMQAVIETGQYPGAKFIFRALGDCPFLDTGIVRYSANSLDVTGKEAMVYHLPPETWPIYGSREFPYSLAAWRRIVSKSRYREHPDQYFHQNRRQFDILYHQPPDQVYFRNYRIEVDYPEDLELVRVIAEKVGMLAPLKDVIEFLDKNQDVAQINCHHNEKTGPLTLTTYDNHRRRKWLTEMQGEAFWNWDGQWIEPPDKKAAPIFCNCRALVGWGVNGNLRMMDGSIMQAGFPRCPECKLVVREWQQRIAR